MSEWNFPPVIDFMRSI